MITLTSNSMDELNGIYRKLKKHYKAADNIKLDSELLTYRLDLVQKEVKPEVRNLLEKIIDYCDELQDDPVNDIRSFSQFLDNYESRYPNVKQLNSIWATLSQPDKLLAVDFLTQGASDAFADYET